MEQLAFPLNQPSMRPDHTTEYLQGFRFKSELEKALDALEPPKEKEEEKPENFLLNLQEIQERRNETAKLRVQQVKNFLGFCL